MRELHDCRRMRHDRRVTAVAAAATDTDTESVVSVEASSTLDCRPSAYPTAAQLSSDGVPFGHGESVPWYGSCLSSWQGSILLLFGLLGMLVNGLGLAVGETYSEIGHGFWCGITFIITGSFGIGAGVRRTICPIVTYMIFCIFSSFLSVILVIIGFVGSFFCDVILTCYNDFGWRLTIECIIIFVGVVGLFTSAWGSVICCYAICCYSRKAEEVSSAFSRDVSREDLFDVTSTLSRNCQQRRQCADNGTRETQPLSHPLNYDDSCGLVQPPPYATSIATDALTRCSNYPPPPYGSLDHCGQPEDAATPSDVMTHIARCLPSAPSFEHSTDGDDDTAEDTVFADLELASGDVGDADVVTTFQTQPPQPPPTPPPLPPALTYFY